MSTYNTSTAPALLGGVTAAVLGGFNLFQIVAGAAFGLQGVGSQMDRTMGWTLAVIATLSLIGVVQAVRGARRSMDGVADGSESVRRGAHLASGMAFLALLPTSVATGFPVAIATVVLLVALRIALPKIVRGFEG